MRTKQLHHLINKTDYLINSTRFKSFSELRKVYLVHHIKSKTLELLNIEDILKNLYSIYSKDTFNHRLSKNLEQIDRVLQLMQQYTNGQLQRRVWAQKMLTRNMKHLFYEEFYEVLITYLLQKILLLFFRVGIMLL